MRFSVVFRCGRAVVGMVLFAVVCVVSAMGQMGSSGSVTGAVRSGDGAPVAGAAVTLVNPDGPTFSTTTGSAGEFSLGNLASGGYILRVRAAGFAAYEQPGVSVAIGRTTNVAVRLAPESVKQSMTVSGQPTTFDPTQTASVVNIDRDRVEELPIPSRNYLTFVRLAPQVAPMNPALAEEELAPESAGFSFGGLRPGSNAVYLDSTNDNDEYRGGSRTQLSPEAINDFQIVNHGFAAESGGGSGGSIDVETREGLNHVHGDAFAFVQNGALNGTPPLELVPRKPDENRERFGLSQGGAIRRNRSFYYVAAELEAARGEDAGDLPPGLVSAIDSAVARGGPVSSVRLRSGFFPTTDQETELSARWDQQLGERHTLMVRYALTNTRNVNDAFHTDELADFSARGSSFLDDNSVNGTLTSSFGEKALNRFAFEVAERREVERTVDASTAGVVIPGVAEFGTPYFGNNRHFEVHTEFADSVSVARHGHLVQAGVRGDRVAVRSVIPDGAQGLYVFPTVAALAAGTPDSYVQTFGDLNQDLSEVRLDAFVQDHWVASKQVTVDFGVRYDANLLPAPAPAKTLDFAPRVGVAWTPYRPMVVRAGFGVFYDRYLLSTLARVLDRDGTKAFTKVADGPAAAAVYQGGLSAGQGGSSAGANGVPSRWTLEPGLPNPYSEVASLSVEQQLPLETTLTAEYQFVHGVHLGRTTNVNLPQPVVLTTANAAGLGIAAPAPQQLGAEVFPGTRLNPGYDAIQEFATSAGSSYSGGTVSLNRQFQDNLEILAGYTYSKTMDDASYDLEEPQNPYDLGAERALSLLDQRHRLTLSGLYLIGPDTDDPADAASNANPGPWMRALTGFEFAPILLVTSGYRANPVTGLDSNREHVYPFAARPQGYGRNSLKTAPVVNFDMRILRMVPIWRGHLDIVAESFNLLNHPNPALLDPVYGVGVQAQAGFGRPIEDSDARRVQFSLDYEY